MSRVLFWNANLTKTAHIAIDAGWRLFFYGLAFRTFAVGVFIRRPVEKKEESDVA